MRILYGQVDLGVLELHEFVTEPVYDDSGVDYLYTRCTVSARCIINGQAQIVSGQAPNGPFISYAMDNRGDPNPTLTTGDPNPFGPDRGYPNEPVEQIGVGFPPANVGIAEAPSSILRTLARVLNPPPFTHADIRHRLTTPRQRLTVYAGPGRQDPRGGGGNLETIQTMLDSPQFGTTCDCKNGPIPRMGNVMQALGDANTLFFDWSCETYINEGPQNGVNWAGALLSNRFSQTHVVNEDGYTAAATGGVAIFRTDFIYELASNPDANRPLLFLPIPHGFVRENIQVEGLPDVTGVKYGFTDRQVPVSFPAGPYVRAASIEAVHRQSITTNADLIGSAFTGFERYWGQKANKNFAANPGKTGRPANAVGGLPPGFNKP